MSPADRIEELEAEVAYLRSELGLSVTVTKVAAIKHGLGLALQQAQIMAVLHEVYPRILTRFQLWDAIDHPYEGCDSNATNSIDVRVCHIRAKIGAGVFAVEKRLGLGLSPDGKSKVDACLNPSPDSSPGDFALRHHPQATRAEAAYSVPEKRSAA